MFPRRTLLVVVLLAAVVVASGAVYYYVRSQQTSLVMEEGVSITHLDLNRKTSTLVGANVSSQSGSALSLVSARLVKVQTGISVASTTFTSPITLPAGGQVVAPLGFKLDPEGADYILYIYTSKGTVVKGTLSYP